MKWSKQLPRRGYWLGSPENWLERSWILSQEAPRERESPHQAIFVKTEANTTHLGSFGSVFNYRVFVAAECMLKQTCGKSSASFHKAWL